MGYTQAGSNPERLFIWFRKIGPGRLYRLNPAGQGEQPSCHTFNRIFSEILRSGAQNSALPRGNSVHSAQFFAHLGHFVSMWDILSHLKTDYSRL